MQQLAKDIYKKILEFTMELQSDLPDLDNLMQQQRNIQELVDTAYAIKQMFDVLEDMLKHVRASKTRSEKLVCLLYALQTSYEPIRTDYCTASPSTTDMPQIPSKHAFPEEYAAFMQALGCPAEMIEADGMRPHWPGLVDLMATWAIQGKPIPEGLKTERTYPVYAIKFRKKKSVLEE